MGSKKGINVLSLFDGISCGQQALKENKIKVNKFFASEIHVPSIKLTQKNFPTTIQLGNVINIKGNLLPKIDLLIGGSPCQGFSFGGKQLNFNDPRSKLFFEFVRVYRELKKINPKLKVLLENVYMKKEYEDVITKQMGIEPIKIDSRVFGACLRKRIYWTNIKINEIPLNDHKLLIRDCLVNVPVYKADKRGFTSNWKYQATGRVFLLNEKAPCIIKIAGKRGVMIATSFKTCRSLTPLEIERVMGLPDNFTKGVSMSERYGTIGNGWHVPTIKFLFQNLK